MKISTTACVLCFALLVLCNTQHASAGTVNYTYDNAGRLTQADYGDKVINYTYDNAGNLTKREVTAGGLWSGATDLGDGWKYLDWFGYFWVDEVSQWIYHYLHGWVYPYGEETASIWFYTIDRGWFWTSDLYYPWIYVLYTGVWDVWQ
ncbi:MAG: hypothetical protein SV775_05595 [Thermodesulfobacteriota bacterium]|nr:hypothetical protein [Thermodesulfobacteriota bacterium]